MNPIPTLCTLAALTAALPWTRWQEDAPAKQDGAVAPAELQRDPFEQVRVRALEDGTLLHADEIVFERYTPRTMRVNELRKLVDDVRGREFWIVERGGLQSRPTRNLTEVQDSLLVMDRAGEVREILALVHQLEQLHAADAGGAVARTLEFSPRYLSLDAIQAALGGPTQQRAGGGPEPLRTTLVRERDLALLRGTEEQLDQALRLLTRLDVPAPQVKLTVWIATADERDADSRSEGLPDELAADLEALLPGFVFESDGYSVVRSSVAAGRAVELEVDGGREQYSVRLRPSAYDEEAGHLTLESCSFAVSVPSTAPGDEPPQGSGRRSSVLFQTSAVIRTGEYTVLGAAGREPVFLVLQVERVPLR